MKVVRLLRFDLNHKVSVSQIFISQCLPLSPFLSGGKDAYISISSLMLSVCLDFSACFFQLTVSS